jgi:hypothetical protein
VLRLFQDKVLFLEIKTLLMMLKIKILRKLLMSLLIDTGFKIIKKWFKIYQEDFNGYFLGLEEELNYLLIIMKKELYRNLNLS